MQDDGPDRARFELVRRLEIRQLVRFREACSQLHTTETRLTS